MADFAFQLQVALLESIALACHNGQDVVGRLLKSTWTCKREHGGSVHRNNVYVPVKKASLTFFDGIVSLDGAEWS
jgi:hypothetical protein